MFFANQINVSRALFLKCSSRPFVTGVNKATTLSFCRCLYAFAFSGFEGTRPPPASRPQRRANSSSIGYLNVWCESGDGRLGGAGGSATGVSVSDIARGCSCFNIFTAAKKRQVVTPVSVRTLCSAQGQEPWNCHHKEMVERVENGDATIIDVRRADEIQETGLMRGALHIPLDELKQAFHLPSDKFEKLYGMPLPEGDGSEIIFSCRSGVRSRKALDIARECGYTQARHYPGGWMQWAEENKL